MRRLLVLLLLLSTPAAARAQGPVKVGLLLPYTGVLSVQGIDTTRGVELHLAKVGGKAGGREVQEVIGPMHVMRTERQGGRMVNAILDTIPSVSQEHTWTWWNKK